MQRRVLSGISLLSKQEKLDLLRKEGILSEEVLDVLASHLHGDSALQSIYEGFSENTVSNFYLPFSLVPNFLVNDRLYCLPYAIEESSVVAAAGYAAKFWARHGGFRARIIDTVKNGHVHFIWTGKKDSILDLFDQKKEEIKNKLGSISAKMKKRGGGVLSMQLIDKTSDMKDLWQIKLEFRTADAMGANFINTVLEALASHWQDLVNEYLESGHLQIIMSILSNYTPESLVEVFVEAPLKAFGEISGDLEPEEFADRFRKASDISTFDPYRAVTNNKGIFNGIDALVIATGNDFRAVEACGHAYAASDGTYRGLSKVNITDDTFRFSLRIPMAVGVVGGLTSNHPMAKIALEILDDPSAEELMMIIASAGLANNFSALFALVTTGIQKGHMKMHLSNILQQFGASDEQKQKALPYFKERKVSHDAVRAFLEREL